MADPAGLIALGIESCKLIVRFIDDWRGFDDDLDNLKVKAEGLLSTLKLISSLLSQNPAIQPAIGTEIAAKVMENEQWIKKINQRVAKWSLATQNAGLGDKVRAAGKKITYPFRREALLATVKILEGLQMNLHTALLALQLQQASLLVQQTQLLYALGTSTLSALQRHEAGFNSIELAIGNSTTTQPPAAVGTVSRREHALALWHRFACEQSLITCWDRVRTYDYPPVIGYLINAGCPVNEIAPNPDEWPDGTPLDFFIENNSFKLPTKFIDAVSRMIDLGAVITDASLYRLPSVQKLFFQKEEGFLVSDIIHAIMSQSIRHLRDSLKDIKSTKATGWPEVATSLLKLCLDWQEGFDTLLQVYHQHRDNYVVLHAAIMSDNLYATNALLDQGTPFPVEYVELGKSTEISRLLLETVIRRRQRLLELAETNLPIPVLNKLDIRCGILPNANARDVYLEVKACRADDIFALDPLWSDNIYNRFFNNTKSMETLYEAGFRDVNGLRNGKQSFALRYAALRSCWAYNFSGGFGSEY
ncbi:hypothetical protein BDW74DRAFT_174776 [Aspergillus multicolor]|uniref:uncharacterized protein n=1 Tax=Aspergillus multicolor TaxID=41759 RepID=UPI003CCD5230